MNMNRVQQLASQYSNYDMIRQHTELPSFPDYQIRLMLSFLRHDLKSSQRHELYSLVTSLVQIGLDTHDLVRESNRSISPQQMRAQQLQVLAGDYLSGRYYELLSSAEEIEAIRTIADAICDVNQVKMNLYMRKLQRDLSGEQYLQQLLAIRTRLFLAFETEIEVTKRSLWRSLLENGTLAQIMLLELEKLEQLDEQYDGWAVWELISLISVDERESYQSVLDKPEQFQRWIARYGIRERLHAKINQAADSILPSVDRDDTDPEVLDAVLSLVEQLRLRSAGTYTYARGEADGCESQGEACSRSI